MMYCCNIYHYQNYCFGGLPRWGYLPLWRKLLSKELAYDWWKRSIANRLSRILCFDWLQREQECILDKTEKERQRERSDSVGRWYQTSQVIKHWQTLCTISCSAQYTELFVIWNKLFGKIQKYIVFSVFLILETITLLLLMSCFTL